MVSMDIKNLIKVNSPSIMLGLGIAGFIGAVVMAVKVGPAVQESLEETKDEPFIEKVKDVAPILAPTVGMVLLSTGLILAANKIVSQRYAALMALYSISEKNMNRLQKAVEKEFGEKKAEKVRYTSTEPEIDIPNDLLNIIEGDERKSIFFDEFSGRYFVKNTVEEVRAAVNAANEFANREGFVSLNEFYVDYLGLERTGFGDEIGWAPSGNGIMQVHFDAHFKMDRAVVVITFANPPTFWSNY